MATSQDLAASIAQVRGALDVLDARGIGEERRSEIARDLGVAVDNLRRTVWAVLTTKHSGDIESFLARIRMRRATEICEEALADLYAGTVSLETPGLFEFHLALTDLTRRMEGES